MFTSIQLELIAQGLVESGYCVLEHAIDADLLAGLSSALNHHYIEGMSRAGIGRGDDYTLDDSVRRDKIHWISADSSAEEAWLTQMENLRAYLNQQLFLGLRSFESHFALYEPGAFYQKHRDAFRGAKSRFVSVVCYLNENWQADWGGELVLYDGDSEDTILERVEPLARRVVIFLSEDIPHEVQVAHRSRISIAGWFRL